MNKTKTVNEQPANLSRKIFERFLSQEQMTNLLNEYNGHKLRKQGGHDRAINLEEKLTEFEKLAMDHYYNSTDIPMSEFADEAHKPVSACLSAVNRGTRKLFYQNIEKFTADLK